MKLNELDSWYKENEAILDDLRGVKWGKLSHSEKLEIYNIWSKQDKAERELQGRASRRYHARPEVIQYFRENRLLHESGDYRNLNN